MTPSPPSLPLTLAVSMSSGLPPPPAVVVATASVVEGPTFDGATPQARLAAIHRPAFPGLVASSIEGMLAASWPRCGASAMTLTSGVHTTTTIIIIMIIMIMVVVVVIVIAAVAPPL